MNEKLSNNSENVQDSKNEWADLSDVPFAGGRVEDVEKARAMAEASNFHESLAAHVRANQDPSTRGYEKAIEIHERNAKIAAEKAAQEYDGIQNDGLVEDVDKARAMAEAENSDRSIAAEKTRAASIAEGKDYKARGELIEDLRNRGFSIDEIKKIFNNPDKIRKSAAEHSSEADKQGERAGYLYDAEHHEDQNN